MSFLHDHEVYLKVVDSAFKKIAQDAEAANVNAVAKKLVSRLSKEVGAESKVPNISSGTDIPVGLTTVNLQNLGNLLKFLDTNQIKVDGTRVVYNEQENSALPEVEQNKLSPVTINVSRDAATRKWNTADYYTNLPSLIKYVGYLQNKAKEDNNAVLSVMIGKLVDQVNAIKPDSGLTRTPKSVPGKVVNELADDVQLDGFGTKVFDAKSLTTNNGGVGLFAKDLKDRNAFNAWMLNAPEAQIITYDDKGKKLAAVKYSDPKANVCVIINTLFNRAKNLAERESTSAADAQKYGYYIKKIQEIGQTFSDPEGNACTVSGTYRGTTEGDTIPASDKTNREQGGTGGTVRTQVDDSIIRNIVSSFPLAIADINLDRILEFANEMRKLSSGVGERSARISSYIGDLSKQIIDYKKLTTHQDTIIPLNTSAAYYQGSLRTPGSYYESLATLRRIVDLTRKLMAEFNYVYGDKLSDSEKTTLLGQIGRGPTDSSIYMRNMRQLDSLIRDTNKVLNVTHKG